MGRCLTVLLQLLDWGREAGGEAKKKVASAALLLYSHHHVPVTTICSHKSAMDISWPCTDISATDTKIAFDVKGYFCTWVAQCIHHSFPQILTASSTECPTRTPFVSRAEPSKWTSQWSLSLDSKVAAWTMDGKVTTISSVSVSKGNINKSGFWRCYPPLPLRRRGLYERWEEVTVTHYPLLSQHPHPGTDFIHVLLLFFTTTQACALTPESIVLPTEVDPHGLSLQYHGRRCRCVAGTVQTTTSTISAHDDMEVPQ